MKARTQTTALFATLCFVVATLIGCATFKKVLAPDRVYAVTEFAAYNTATQLLKQDATKRGPLELARNGFCDLNEKSVWDIRAATAIALDNGLQHMVSDEGDILIAGGLMLVDLFGPTLDLSVNAHAKAFISASCSGLTKALAVAATPAGLMTTTARKTGDAIWADLAAKAKATRPR
jgi:hypothetical protein